MASLLVTAIQLQEQRGSSGLPGTVTTSLVPGTSDSLCDLTHSERDDCGWPVGDALARIDAEGAGVVVILRHDVTAGGCE